MTCRIIDGHAIAWQIRQEIKEDVAVWRTKYKIQPRLAVILVGNDPASMIYVQHKQKACEEVGIATLEARLPSTTRMETLLTVLHEFQDDPTVHGVLVQLPLPSHLDKFRLFDAISVEKDVDVFSPVLTGKLVQGRAVLQPCTPQAVQEVLVRTGIPIHGQHVVIVSRSLIVGQPLAVMLVQDRHFANATVTVCHEFTKNIQEIMRMADILVTAVGKRDRFVVTGDVVKPGSTVIDVAIIRDGKKIMGDVDVESVTKVAGVLSPSPRGIGPTTVACLLRNTFLACKRQCEH